MEIDLPSGFFSSFLLQLFQDQNCGTNYIPTVFINVFTSITIELEYYCSTTK